jgi:hypothetical protein
VPRPASSLAADVAQRARGATGYVGRLERLYQAGELSRQDMHRSYGGAYLSFFTLFERSLENLFLGLLMGRLTCSQATRSLVEVRSDVVARRLVAGGRSYADWLPFDHTITRAETFLSGGRPFTDVSSVDRNALKRAHYIRNAVAHESNHSLRQFQRHVIGQQFVPVHELRPAPYLRGAHAAGQSRLDFVLAELVFVFDRMCA